MDSHRQNGIEPPRSILVVEDEHILWPVVRSASEEEAWTFHFVGSGEEALSRFGDRWDTLDLAIVDLGLPGMSGLAVLEAIRSSDPTLPVLILTGQSDAASVVQCLRSGAHDYLTKPYEPTALRHRIRLALETRSLLRRCARFETEDDLAERMGPSEAVRRIATLVRQVAPTRMSVLIQGESGTGKELVARRVHALSGRGGAFVPVDCGAIPETLMEGELFGFRKGSFTGAVADRQGKFQAAHEGTLFLDEIGNLPLQLQSKLLRVLQQREVTPIGADHPVPVDARIVCATNGPLDRRVAAGEFRLDLYHRVAEFPVTIPPLRERHDDLLYLCGRIAKDAAVEFGKDACALSEEALRQVLSHPWPGNARELAAVLRRAVLVSEGRIERLDLAPSAPRVSTMARRSETERHTIIRAQAVIPRGPIEPGGIPFKDIVRGLVREVEREILADVLDRVGGNLSQAARVLNLDYKTVLAKVKDADLHPRKGALRGPVEPAP